MRDELESYGIFLRQFMERNELKHYLFKARREMQGRPKKRHVRFNFNRNQKQNYDTKWVDDTFNGGVFRDDHIRREMASARYMSIGALQQELHARGIRTDFFRLKSQFVRAYAEAIVDGTPKTHGHTGGWRGYQYPDPPPPPPKEQKFDPSFQDVQMKKVDALDPYLRQGIVIDLTEDPLK